MSELAGDWKRRIRRIKGCQTRDYWEDALVRVESVTFLGFKLLLGLGDLLALCVGHFRVLEVE
jgi:hypothetical protein